jgi:hypothetical protein
MRRFLVIIGLAMACSGCATYGTPDYGYSYAYGSYSYPYYSYNYPSYNYGYPSYRYSYPSYSYSAPYYGYASGPGFNFEVSGGEGTH